MAKFQKGAPGRPEGSKNKNTVLRGMIMDAFEENREKAVDLINKMFDNKSDFKWLCQLQASLEPKVLDMPAPETHLHLTTIHALHEIMYGLNHRFVAAIEHTEQNGNGNGLPGTNGHQDSFRVD